MRLLAQNRRHRTGTWSDAALASQVTYRDWQQQPTFQPIETNKGISVARSRLASAAQPIAVRPRPPRPGRPPAPCITTCKPRPPTTSSSLADPAFAAQLGLLGPRLLTPASTAQVRYSFTLYEMTADGARVRVQTDNTDQPFDINESSKLELGSTAKLRVLTTYLQIISELHDRYGAQPAAALKKVSVDEQDRLSRWAVD